MALGEPGEYGFPGHLPLFATFKWAQLFQKANKLAKPADLPRREEESGKAEKKAKAACLAPEGENLIGEASADWTAAVQARDTEAAWKVWCTTVETLFLRWAKQEGLWDGDEEEEKTSGGLRHLARWIRTEEEPRRDKRGR